jgi:hypothetical protein
MNMPPLSAEQMQVVNGTNDARHWAGYIDRHRNHNDATEDGLPIVRMRGVHYVFRPYVNDVRSASFLGHGGRTWEVRTLDGRVLKSNDVWCQGDIPLALRAMLPDNAEKINDEYEPVMVPTDECQHVLEQLSIFGHPTYAVDFTVTRETVEHDGKQYTEETDAESRHEAPMHESHVWSSVVRNVVQPKNWVARGFSVGQSREIDGVQKVIVESRERNGPHATTFADGLMQQVQDGWHTVMIDVDHACRLVRSSTPGHYHLYIDVAMPWWRYRRLLRALKNCGIIEPGYYSASVARKATHVRLPWVRKADIETRRSEARQDDAEKDGEMF